MPETTPLTDLIPSASVAHHPSVIEMLFSSGPVVQAVLIILLLLSIFTWAITIAKYVQIRRARQDSDEFYSIFWDSRSLERVDDSCKRLGASPIAQIFSTGYREMLRVVDAVSQNRAKGGKGASTTDLDTIKRALVRSEANEFEKLEKGSTFLATVASAAPFIGLFGTVWGIMTAFQGLGTAKSATIQAVAPGISEALVATAVGLAAAIPAAIAFNYLASSLRGFRDQMNRFSDDFINLAEKQLAER